MHGPKLRVFASPFSFDFASRRQSRMWTAIRRRARQKSESTRHYVIGTALVLWSIFVVFFLVRSFLHLPAALRLSQRCRMSRMWPSYIPYNVPSPSGFNKKYRLFLYREAYPGRNKEEDEPRGRPALFIPGNAGSFGQVRSVASSAHHLFKSGQGGNGITEVDWWTVDFNEDFSAFHGQTMHDQAEYINEVLHFLLDMYPSTHHIPILAHSMGGLVARLMMLKDRHPPKSVDTIITLSSPHAYPPVPIDGGVEQVYHQINSQWEKIARDTLLISLSGGILDNQLSSEPSSLLLARIWHENASLSAFTSSLAGLWSGVDHLAMMWCDQLRERIARGVLRIEGQDTSLGQRREKWRRVLGIEHNGQFVLLSDDQSSPDESKEGHTLSKYAVADAGHHKNAFELITDLSVGLDTSFGPPLEQEANIRVDLCSKIDARVSCRHVLPSAYNLYPPSPHTDQASKGFPSFPIAEERYEVPGHGYRRLSIGIDQLKEQKIDHIRVEGKTTSGGLLVVSWTAPAEIISRSLPLAGKIFVPLNKVKDSISPSRSAIVSELDSSLLAYDLTIVASKQGNSLCHLKSAPILRAQSLSTGDTQYYPSIRSGSKFALTLHSTSPYMPPASSSHRGTQFTLLLDTCSQISGVSISINWKASIGLLLSRYRTALGSLPLATLLILMSVMWEEWDQGATFSSLSTSAVQYASYLAPQLVLISILLSTLQRILSLLSSPSSNGLASPYLQDLTYGLASSSLFTNASLAFLFLTSAYGLCLLVSILLDLSVSLFASLVRVTSAKASLRSAEEGSNSSKSRLSSIVISFAILAIIVWLAVPIQFVFLVLFLIQLHCAVQTHLAAQNERETGGSSRANQQLVLLNLYFWLLPSNAPALLIWTRNLLRGYYGISGGPDHNIIYVIGFLAITYISSNGELLHKSRYGLISFITRASMIASSILSIAYGIRYTYVLFRFANIVTAWLAFAHFMESGRTKFAFSAVSQGEDHDPLQMQEGVHSSIPESINGTNSLPQSLSASLKTANSKGYTLEDEESGEALFTKATKIDSRDVLLERYLDLLDEYFDCKKQISDDVIKGHFHLSKARMQLGRLTSMNDSWDARMKAKWAVRIQNEGQFLLERVQSNDDDIEETEGKLIGEKGESSLRRRKGNRPESHTEDIIDKSEKKGKAEKVEIKKGQPYDPLYQFAALPPPSLRQAQSSFSSVLTRLIDGKGTRNLLQIESELKNLERLIEQKK